MFGFSLLLEHCAHSAKGKILACDGVGELFVFVVHHVVVDFVASEIAFCVGIICMEGISFGGLVVRAVFKFCYVLDG